MMFRLFYLVFLTFIVNTSSIPSRKPVYIALAQPNIKPIYNRLTDISNPTSKNYGKWLSLEEVDNLVKSISDENAINSVSNWLRSNGIHQLESNGDSIKFWSEPVKISNIFKLEKTSQSYKIPAYLEKYISFVEMSVKPIPHKIKRNIKSKSEQADDRFFGRESMIRLYNLPNRTIGKVVSGGLIEYQNNQGFTNSDLNQQQVSNNQHPNNITNIVGVNTGTDGESELDVQVISQAADGIDLWYWQSPYWLYSLAVDFNLATDIPDVISMSWGWAEDLQCDIVECGNLTSKEYIDRVNYEYMKILLRGTTILASSGDSGAPGRSSEGCDATRPVNGIFPGSSEFVTSVGATFVETTHLNLTTKTKLCQNQSCVEGNIEHVTNFDNTSWTSGGGFNNYTNYTPYWQSKEVANYLKHAPSLPNSSTFNSNSRVYPDVSLVGHSCPTYINGYLGKLDGTSCSSPLMAGVVAVINDHQLRKRRSKVGYFNPLLYHIARNCPKCFNDIPDGNNWCTEELCCDNPTQFGYQGIVGFDPVTGLGSPNIQNILSFLDRFDI